jgi:hypothetical protein
MGHCGEGVNFRFSGAEQSVTGLASSAASGLKRLLFFAVDVAAEATTHKTKEKIKID